MIEEEHLLRQLGMRDVEESAERMVIEMDNRPDLANVRGALQGGLVATLIDIAAGRLAGNVVGPDKDGRGRLATRATLSFAVLERR